MLKTMPPHTAVFTAQTRHAFIVLRCTSVHERWTQKTCELARTIANERRRRRRRSHHKPIYAPNTPRHAPARVYFWNRSTAAADDSRVDDAGLQLEFLNEFYVGCV